MKKIIAAALLLALLFALFTAAGKEDRTVQTSNGGVKIVATCFPAYDFARQIAGERADITLLVPPGAELHSFEPTAQDIIAIESCGLLICNGGESESWLEEILEGREGEINVLSMLECVDALEEEEKEGMQEIRGEHEHHHDEHDGHDEHEEHMEHETEYDEHVWTSPVNAGLICRCICQRLCSVDSEGTEYYSERLDEYCAELDKLHSAFLEVREDAVHDCLIFADRFPVRYFVEEYGLDYYAAFPGCAEDTEPSAKTVAFLIDKVKAEDINAVMHIEYSNEKMADIICEDTGCEKLLFHSCHTVSADDFERGVTYLSLMWANVESVREALD